MLIDEIEAAAKRIRDKQDSPWSMDACISHVIRDGRYWPRIRAALVAARELAKTHTRLHDPHSQCATCDAVRKFREAMGE